LSRKIESNSLIRIGKYKYEFISPMTVDTPVTMRRRLNRVQDGRQNKSIYVDLSLGCVEILELVYVSVGNGKRKPAVLTLASKKLEVGRQQ